MKNDELKLTTEKLIMDESLLSPAKEIAYRSFSHDPSQLLLSRTVSAYSL